MCFRCQNCNEVHKTPKKVVTQTRDKEYPNGSSGHEIVKEMIVCESCYPKEEE